MANERQIRLRYPATCARCGGDLERGTSAWWDGATKAARCLSCDEETRSGYDAAGIEPPVPGDAGGSAAREWARRKQRREERIRARFPRIGGIILALTEDPQSTRAWKKGAEGERLLSEQLDRITEEEAVVLHDRLMPGSRANIDHLVVAPAGVFVIDAKQYQGRVEKRDVGGFFRSGVRLYVGRRDFSKLVAGVQKQTATVREVLKGEDGASAPAPVHGVLCFVRGDWALFARPMPMDDVTVTWPKELTKRITEAGPLSRDGVARVGALLAERLPPA